MTDHRIRALALRAAAPLAVLPLLLAPAASHAATRQIPVYGTVKGVLELFGGPAPGRAYPRAGVVTARNGTISITARANTHGRFKFRLFPGRYRLTGHIRHERLRCTAPHPIRVRAHETVRINVICPVP